MIFFILVRLADMNLILTQRTIENYVIIQSLFNVDRTFQPHCPARKVASSVAGECKEIFSAKVERKKFGTILVRVISSLQWYSTR